MDSLRIRMWWCGVDSNGSGYGREAVFFYMAMTVQLVFWDAVPYTL